MCEQSEQNNKCKWIKNALVFVVLLAVAIGAWWSFFPFHKTIHVTANNTIYLADSIKDSDSTIYKTSSIYYVHQIDSLKSIVQNINDRYQDEIDIMINKSNGWLGFWLSLITILLGVLAFVNWYDRSKQTELIQIKLKEIETEKKELVAAKDKIKDDFNKLKEDSTMLKDDFVKEKNIIIKNKNEILKEKRNFESEKVKELGKIKELTTIASLSECLLSLPDPSYMSKDEDRKSQVLYLLENLQKSYSQFVSHVSREQDNVKRSEMTYTIVLVLIDIKVAVLNSQRILSSLNENIRFYNFLKDLSKHINTLRSSGIVSDNDIQKLGEISKDFSQLISECKMH